MTEVILPGLAGGLKPLRNEKKMTQKEMPLCWTAQRDIIKRSSMERSISLPSS